MSITKSTYPILIISGPSGIGKDYLKQQLESQGNFQRIVMCTTREPRSNEIQGVDYEFLSQEEYREATETGDLLINNSFYNNSYGTRHSSIQRAYSNGNIPIAVIHTTKVVQFINVFPNSYRIFLRPSNIGILINNLMNRDGNLQRLESALEEIETWENQFSLYYDKIFLIESRDFSPIYRYH